MLNIQKQPGQRILELGGGQNRHPASDVNCDVRPGPGVDFTADFDKVLPIQSNEWDGVLSIYVLEHVAWRSMRQFMSEVFRITKPGGICIFITPNIEAQVAWAQRNPEGWDGKPFFESFSEIIFGSQNYGDNLHKSSICPSVALDLFRTAGFENVMIAPHGERNTDLAIQAVKPSLEGKVLLKPEEPKQVPLVIPASAKREELFDHRYFNGGHFVGGYANVGYWDYPIHEATVEVVLKRKPESILELAPARGYLLKRFEDRGIRCKGLEISRHCWLTRACDSVVNWDVCKTPWPVKDKEFDLCFSCAFLEHVPKEFLPAVAAEMERTCKRGLHGIDFGANDDGFDKTHCSLMGYSDWREILPSWQEIVDKQELENESDFPLRLLNDPEKRAKLNIGCGISLYHNGWLNVDSDKNLTSLTEPFRYGFSCLDVRKGLPYPTGTIELMHLSRFLEFLTYTEAREVLRELRRIIKPDGLMRIGSTDVALLNSDYLLNECPVMELNRKRDLSDYDELSAAVKEAKTDAEKLWALTKGDGQLSCWDAETLLSVLKETGWEGKVQPFRVSDSKMMLAETIDQLPAISFYCDARPLMERK